MIVLHRPRESGKTTELVGFVKADPIGVLVCFNSDEAKRVAEKFELPKEKVISFSAVLDRHLAGTRANLYIDNIELVFRGNGDFQVVAMSVSE